MQPLNVKPSPSILDTLLSIPRYLIRKLWEVVSSVASAIFSTFTCCCFPKEFFNSREITLLRDERSTRNPPSTLPLTPLIDRNITDKTPTEPLPSDEPFNHKEPKYNVFDDSLENFRSFSREFSVLGIDVLYENMVVDNLDTVQTIAPSIPPIIKSVAKLLVEMGDKASKPLFKRFSEQKAQTIDPALQKIFKTLLKPDLNLLREKLSVFLNEKLTDHPFEEEVSAADYVNSILNWVSTSEDQRPTLDEWLLKNKKWDPVLAKQLLDKAQLFWNDQIDSEKRKLYLSLEELLCEEFKETKVPPKQSIDNDYIRPILAWLLLSNQSIPLNNIFGVVDAQKEELIDKVFERLISLLVEKKVDQYSNFLEKTVQRHLGDIIHQTLQKNAVRVSDFFSERASELISKMAFTETVDSLIHNTMHQQVQGVNLSEEKREEEKQFLKKATAIANIVPDNAESLDAQIRAQNHLNSVAKHGGNEAYLEHTLLEAYSKHPACNPFIKQMIEQEIQLVMQGKEAGSVRRANEKALYTNISETLLELMMPIRKRLGSNGEIEEIDPFMDLWDRLYWPNELHDLIKQYEDLTQEFATPETTALLEKIKLPAVEIIKKTFVVIAKDKLKKQLVSVVQAAFEKITDPEKVDKINAEDALPKINKNILEAFAKQELGRNLNQFAPMFYELVTADSAEQDGRRLQLQQRLIQTVTGKFEQFDPEEFYGVENEQAELDFKGLSDQEWSVIAHSVVDELEKNILHAKINQVDFNPKTTSLGEVSDILKKAYKSEFKDNNPNFGNLGMDILFKLGKFDNEFWISYFLKDKLSASITESVEPWRRTHKKLIETLTESLKSTFLDPAAVKELLTDTPPKPNPLREQKLAHQIDVTARLAYDLIIASANGGVLGWGTKKFLKGNSDEINQAITKIYKKLFGNKMLNQSLIVNATEAIFKSLATAAEQVHMAENIKAHQLAAREA
jgi:hypothetical protein